MCYLVVQVQLKSLNKKNLFFNENLKPMVRHFSNLTLYVQRCVSGGVVSLCARTRNTSHESI